MVDIKQYPFFSYGSQIERLMQPLKGQADLELLGYSRMYHNRQRFLICHHYDWATNFYDKELYRYGLYEKGPQDLPSRYDMWDHLPYAPPEVFRESRIKFGLAHGLTIIKQHESYSDFFVFATKPSNSLINSFYLNQKELLETFIENFYEKLAPDLANLEKYRFSVPGDVGRNKPTILTLTKRQHECATLVLEGYNTKEVARILELSPRTVECYLDSLREKLGAKNRLHLSSLLKEIL